jgi:HPt (histidine-containing phosphotransfer) domain-containing protein
MNLDYLYQIADDNEEFVVELLVVLRKNLIELPIAMQQAFDAQQWQELRNTAHKFKSCVAYIGIQDFNRALISLELSEENGPSPHQIKDELRTVCHYSKQILAEIEQLLVKYH